MRFLIFVLVGLVLGCGGDDPLSFGERRETVEALRVAARNGNLAMVKRLLKRLPKKQTNYDRREGRSEALYEAVRGGHLDIVEYLVGAGADVNATNRGRTALYWAAGEGHLDIVEYLVGAGADVNHRLEDGWTALHRAARYGHLLVVQYLLEQGLDVNATADNGYTALHRAAAEGHLLVVQYLVEHGANVHLTIRKEIITQDNFAIGFALNFITGFAFDLPMDTQRKGINLTARDLARRNGHMAVADYLRLLDADYLESADYSESAARAALARRGIAFTADPFVGSARSGNLAVVRLFVLAGMSVDATDRWGYTALHGAAWHGHLDVVEFLVGAGASLTATDIVGWTPRDLAVKGGHTEIVDYFDALDADADG